MTKLCAGMLDDKDLKEVMKREDIAQAVHCIYYPTSPISLACKKRRSGMERDGPKSHVVKRLRQDTIPNPTSTASSSSPALTTMLFTGHKQTRRQVGSGLEGGREGRR